MPDEKKVDESWKEKAKAEKEPSPPTPPPAGPPPPADFSSLIASLATGALMAMGGEAGEGQEGAPDLDRARYAIDLLEVLSKKTKGNLTPDEDRHLAAILHQLRMAFVEAARKPS